MTLLASQPDLPPVLIKCRLGHDGIATEQAMLAAMQHEGVPGIATPRPLGMGTTRGGLSWAAQQFMFTKPHGPYSS